MTLLNSINAVRGSPAQRIDGLHSSFGYEACGREARENTVGSAYIPAFVRHIVACPQKFLFCQKAPGVSSD
jgi:hypothetical protein